MRTVRIPIGNTCGLQIRLHHLGRLPLFQQVEQRELPGVELHFRKE